MRNLEEALKNLAKPEVKVARFKRRLRHELMAEKMGRTAGHYRTAFGLVAGAAAFLMVTLALFIWNPNYPAGIHQWFKGAEPAPLADVAAERIIPLSEQGFSTAENLQHLLGHGNGRPKLLPTTEQDKAYLESWYKQNFTDQTPRIQSVRDENIYSAREFKLNNGQRVLIFTEVPGEKPKDLEQF